MAAFFWAVPSVQGVSLQRGFTPDSPKVAIHPPFS